MGLNDTPASERIHIGFFGKRNSGKSTLVNAVTDQALSVVSEIKGTTTDPVKKAMEILPLGPVVIIDTPGYDDIGNLGKLRVEKTRQILATCHIAVMVMDACTGPDSEDLALIGEIKNRGVPCLFVYNKSDLLNESQNTDYDPKGLFVSALKSTGVNRLKEELAKLAPKGAPKQIIADLLKPGDLTVLVIPIDESAPKGRLILPQQLVMRELLDHHLGFISCQPEELSQILDSIKVPPALVVTDSQAFKSVRKDTPEHIRLTSFSVLFARYKGDLDILSSGIEALKNLKNGSKVLISEGCSHHRQCGDIGSVKIPGWLKDYTGLDLSYSFTSGGEFPTDTSDYDLIIHCGGCMIPQTEMAHRINTAQTNSTPIVNYGILIAHLNGVPISDI